jgi:phage gp29-like protein
MTTPVLLDRWGRPVRRPDLTRDAARPTLTGIRSPLAGYPADGLTPPRLAQMLRDADAGAVVPYLEMAEAIEERDLHYLGVLATRKRSVAQIEIGVEAASDAPADVAMADTVRDWLRRDELTEEIFDILDAIGKGYSFTEIVWETSEGQWRPARLEWRDPRWFRFDRHDLATPLMIADDGTEQPLPPFKFVFAAFRAKSGLALRSGLARVAAWAWMFKAYTQRDWAIFAQTYGQPLRLGRYAPGASDEDRETLFRAVANIAGDCAAIVPESMTIEFIESGSIGASSDLYERRADWLDRQVSKAVLGQTTSTDAISGGHAVSREHRQVQEDIERADARALAGILNRDLVRPWIDLEFGPQRAYPRIVIARPEAHDLGLMSTALAAMIDRGLTVEQSEIRDRFGLSEPGSGASVMVPAASGAIPAPPAASLNGQRAFFKGGPAALGMQTALQAEGRSAALPERSDPATLLADRLEAEARPAMAAMLDRIEAMLSAAGSLEEFREMLLAGLPGLDTGALAAVMAQAGLAAHLAGRVATEDEGGADVG